MYAHPVLDYLDFNGQRYQPGDTVELPPEAAKPLLELGVIGPKSAIKPAKPAKEVARK